MCRLCACAVALRERLGQSAWRSSPSHRAQSFRACVRAAGATGAESTKEQWCEPELYRTKGEVVLRSGDIAAAEADFERALAVARAQQAKSWELRAAMSMARLWRDRGKRVEARDLLAPVYGWFTEGFDTHDLKDAKALLDQLG